MNVQRRASSAGNVTNVLEVHNELSPLKSVSSKQETLLTFQEVSVGILHRRSISPTLSLFSCPARLLFLA